MRIRRLASSLVLLFVGSYAFGQSSAPAVPYYSRLNSFGVFAEYSNDSSHMLLGYARNRKLLDFGGSYTRRLLLKPVVDWQYMAEITPIMLESDPITSLTVVLVSPPPRQTIISTSSPAPGICRPYAFSLTETLPKITYVFDETQTCPGRRWTYGGGFSPVGFKWNFLPRHRLQPVFTGSGGMMFSTRPIPVDAASSVNFIFELGAGIEFYRSHTRSIRAEWRYHHISNGGIADQNPGIDNGLFQVDVRVWPLTGSWRAAIFLLV